MDQRPCTEITRQRWSYLPRVACRSLWATALVPTSGPWARGVDQWVPPALPEATLQPFPWAPKVSKRPHSGSCS